MSFPDIFTVLAELPRCGHGQNMTSSSKPEQTWRSGYILTPGGVDCELEHERHRQVLTTAVSHVWAESRLYQQHHREGTRDKEPKKKERQRERERNRQTAPLSYCCYACQAFHSHLAHAFYTILKFIMIMNFKLNFRRIS